ncbi:MAG: endonuclease MutS2 [Candidatus Cloacimonetes bacterium]|nr:endonuclease MutS2 [Candidatus Cloacimonadota bacterium]
MYELKQLEFDKFLNLLADKCHSNNAKQSALELHPLSDKSTILRKLDLSEEFTKLVKDFSFNFEKLSDVSAIMEDFHYQNYNFEELKKIYINVKLSNRLAGNLTDFEELELIQKMAKKIYNLPEIEKRFTEIFDADGNVLDSASPTLNSLRKKSRGIRKNIQFEISKKMDELDKNNFLFDKISTKRNERAVIPIKEGAVSFIPGIVHGRSSSKSSIYIEPTEIVGLNNNLELNSAEEKQEILKILIKYSAQINDNSKVIIGNTKLLTEFDLYFAIGNISLRFGATKPKIVDEPIVKLIQARHPLLIETLGDIDRVIPFDITLGEEFRLLILSGPNTGGKTVTLKATGLLTLLALSGIPISAKEDSEIGIFQHIFSDIGDQQSLENSLSTFSSHIDKISQILSNGNQKSLILIDEIGAATDPEQGSALAQAILENVITKKMTGIITTHYTSLKIFAESDEFCQNSSMQFDSNKHIPTYHFKPGLPGNSFAIEVAEHLGLDKSLIEKAKELTGSQNIELTSLLKKINEEKITLGKEVYQNQLKNSLLNMKISEYEKKISDLEQEAKEKKKQTLSEAREFIGNIQRDFNIELKQLKKLGRVEKKEELKSSLKKIHKLTESLSEDIKIIELSERKKIQKPRIGEVVWLKDMETEGEIIEITSDRIKVNINGMVFSTNTNNLYRTNKVKPQTTTDYSNWQLEPKEIKFELKLLGLTFDESLPLIRNFLDDAQYAGLNKVRIVHGKGTGVLRNKVRNFLRTQKNIKDYYSPASTAGGFGVTIVEFRDS